MNRVRFIALSIGLCSATVVGAFAAPSTPLRAAGANPTVVPRSTAVTARDKGHRHHLRLFGKHHPHISLKRLEQKHHKHQRGR